MNFLLCSGFLIIFAEEFVNTIYQCLEERNKIAKELSTDNNVIILEKGLDFYDVRVVATLIIKGYTLEQAIKTKEQIRQNYDLEDVEDVKIYLKAGNYNSKSNFESKQDAMYRRYLSINSLLLQIAEIDYKYIEPGDVEYVTNCILQLVKEGTNKEDVKSIVKHGPY